MGHSFFLINTNYRRMKIKELLFLGFVSACLLSCGGGMKKAESSASGIIDRTMALSAKDTAAVLDLTCRFMDAVKEQRYADAVILLHTLKADDAFAQPELLDNDQLETAMQRVKMFPVHSYRIDGYTFKKAYDNDVRCKVFLSPPAADGQTVSTVWYFKPVRFLGEWKLCFRSSEQGDRSFEGTR